MKQEKKKEGKKITMSEKLKEKDALKTSEQITYKEILKNEEINAMIEQGNNVLKCLGYTEHSKKHAAKVAEHDWDFENDRIRWTWDWAC